LSFATPLAVIGNATAGSEIRLPEDTDNGSNYVALKAPNTIASNLTLTLPSADGTSGQVLQTNGSGVLSFASGGGKVLQVIQVTKTDTQSFTGSGGDNPETFNDITNLSASITPSSTSSKILILANVMGYSDNNSFLSVFRGATNLAVPTSPSGRTPAFSGDFQQESSHSLGNVLTLPIKYLDSPSTTSSTTYKLGITIWSTATVYINRSSNDGNFGWQPRGVSSLILMEIGA
jgi:hypothetical protein